MGVGTNSTTSIESESLSERGLLFERGVEGAVLMRLLRERGTGSTSKRLARDRLGTMGCWVVSVELLAWAEDRSGWGRGIVSQFVDHNEPSCAFCVMILS